MAQAYQLLGGFSDNLSLRLHLYDKSVGEAGHEFHGDVTLYAVYVEDTKFFDMGFCLRPADKVIVQ